MSSAPFSFCLNCLRMTIADLHSRCNFIDRISALRLSASVAYQTEGKWAANGTGDGSRWRRRRSSSSTRRAAGHVNDRRIHGVLGISYIVNKYLHKTNDQDLSLAARQRGGRIKHRDYDERIAVGDIGDVGILEEWTVVPRLNLKRTIRIGWRGRDQSVLTTTPVAGLTD